MAKTKTARAEVLPPIDRAFQLRVKTLADEASDVARSYGDLTQRMLKLAEKIKNLSVQATRLDGGSNGKHKRLLQNAITVAIRTTDRGVLSKYVTIGSQAKELLTYKNNLPHQRDGLYEVALAAKDHKPLQKWIADAKLTSESSVREVRALRGGTKKQAHKQLRRQSNVAAVTMYFQSYSAAATALKDVMLSNADFTVRSKQAFGEALKAEVEESVYEKTITPRLN